jgi:hypothetical protein
MRPLEERESVLVFLSRIAPVVAAIFGAYLGYILGFVIGWYSGDRDVGSALMVFITCPIGIVTCSVGAYLITRRALRRWR